MVPLLLLLIVAVLIALVVRRLQERGDTSLPSWLRVPWRTPTPPPTVDVLHQGEVIQAPIRQRAAPATEKLPETDAAPERTRRQLHLETPSRRVLLLAAVALLIVVLVVQLPQAVFAPRQQFLVLVAPFQDPNGSVSPGGQSAAEQLAALLPEQAGGLVASQALNSAPSDAAEALAMLQREGADALIWGTIAPGGVLDDQTLLPMLAYQPSGPYAPRSWDGYSGRFVMPTSYLLASSPLNGQIVLPPLVGALAQYGNGQFDPAFNSLGVLLNDYPALAPALPRALRGNMLWAEGDYTQAAGEYRRTGVMETPEGQGSEMAYLANNLGAILQDAGDSAADSTFAKSVALLNNQDLFELRLNLALGMLAGGRTDEAIGALEPIRAPSSPMPVLLTLARAYREAGRVEDANSALTSAMNQLGMETEAVPDDFGDLVRTRLSAAIAQERGLLALASVTGTDEPLEWSVFGDADASVTELDEPRAKLEDSVRQADTLTQKWNRRAAAKDAAQTPFEAQIASNQARRAEALQRDSERWLSVTEIQIARARGISRPTGMAAFWSSLAGDRSALARATRRLETLQQQQPGDADTAVMLGYARLLSEDRPGAQQAFDSAAAAAPNRPEPLYGQAQLALPDDRPRARDLLARTIAIDPQFYPARVRLAELAQQDRDWAVALEQRRWLATNKPGEATIELARALRESGPAAYTEAEQVLLPLANTDNVDALLELNQLYQAAGDTQAAQNTLLRARDVAPENAEVSYQLGVLYAAQGQNEAAEAALRDAIDRNPGFVQAHIALAHLYESTDRLDLAVQSYSTALERGTDDSTSLKQIGMVLIEAGEYDRAADAFQRALDASPNDPALHHGLGQAYLNQKKLDNATEEEQKAIDLSDGVYPEALVGLGDVALAREDAAGAIERYNQAISQNDRLTGAYLGLGRAAGSQNNWSVAQAHFQQAVQRDPGSPEARLWNGESLIRLGSVAAATTEYEEALRLRPNYPEARFGLAQAQVAAGNLQDASANVALAIRLRPRYAEAFLLQGKIYEQLNQLPQAETAYGRAIDANNRLPEPPYRRALLRISRNELGEARGDLERAVRNQDNFPEAHYWLGRTYLADGRAQPAIDQFTKAIDQRQGNYAEARYYQAIAQEQLGQRDQAIASYRSALEQDRASIWAGEAQAALARLEP